ncbi:MAG: amidinotransferase [Candidatus Marinimicrobia bacterium]|nr:amidinotransferase [Candidatus Neomarinimicrobiota bacterium]
MQFGCQDMVKQVRRVLLKHPRDAFIDQNTINRQYSELNYSIAPNFDLACKHYDLFLDLIKSFGPEIHFLPASDTSIDSIYTHDPCIVTNGGVIISNMGKTQRFNEPSEIEKYFRSIEVPILGHIKEPGTLEGGDIIWIDERTVAVGEGYRSNSQGIDQFKHLLGDIVDIVIPVPLPHWTGPEDCLHLMSNISPIDHDLYLVYSRLLPVSFRKYLLDRKIQLIEVPDEEYASMGCNVLTMGNRKVIMIEGNPITQNKLENEDVDVLTYDGTEISLKGSGGPTCLTRPFLRYNQ